MQKPRKIPQRQCVGCREMKNKRDLIRVVKSPEGEVSLDFSGKKPGRESDDEFCYYKPVGMGVLDLAIAVRVYRRAVELGVGTWLEY